MLVTQQISATKSLQIVYNLTQDLRKVRKDLDKNFLKGCQQIDFKRNQSFINSVQIQLTMYDLINLYSFIFAQQTPVIMASLQSIFNEFDLDASGYIDLSELKEVAKRLGQDISDDQINKIISGIDTNKDGKISFPEFEQWWLKGHKGRLHDLIILKSKAFKAYGEVQQKFKQFGLSFENYKPTSQIDSLSIRLAFGEKGLLKEAKYTGIKIGYLCRENSYQELKNQFNIKNPFNNPKILSLTLKLQTDSPKLLQKTLRQIIKEVLDIFATNFGITINQSDIESNDYLQIKIDAQQAEKYLIFHIEPGPMIAQLMEQILNLKEGFIAKMGEGFQAGFQFQLGVNSSLKQAVSDNKTVVQTLMQGGGANIKVTLSSSAFKLLKGLVFKLSQQFSLLPLLLMRNLDLNLRIRTPQDLQDFFNKLGISEIAKEVPSLKQLLETLAPELQNMKEASQSTEEIPFFNPIHKIFKAFAAHVNSGATLIIGKEKYALYLRIQGDGLNDLYDIVFPNEGEKIN